MTIEEIHNSLVNGQRKQMVRYIDEYGLYDFWEDYKNYLVELFPISSISASNYDYHDSLITEHFQKVLKYFSDAVISYHRIKNR